MRILPKTAAGQIEFARVHVEKWAADPAAIGLSGAEVAEMAALHAAAADAQLAARMAREAAKNATAAAEVAAERLRQSLALAISRIKVAAQASGQPGVVFAAACLPDAVNKPTDPARLQPPVAGNATVSVNARGHATVEWTTGAGGERGRRLGRQRFARTDVQYVVMRSRVGPRGRLEEPTFIGTASEPRIIDERPLPGRSLYTIRPLRGRRRGPVTATVELALPGAPAAEASPTAATARPTARGKLAA